MQVNKISRYFLLLPLLLMLLTACEDPPKDPDPRDEENCEGFVIITKDGDKTVIGDLKCNGICDDGTTRCSVQTSKDGKRQWCGCEGDPEPTFCHVVRIKVGENWHLSCAGPCPVNVDVCKPNKRPGAKPNESVFECPCTAIGDL